MLGFRGWHGQRDGSQHRQLEPGQAQPVAYIRSTCQIASPNRSDLFSRCAPGVDAGDASCSVDENMGHWHVWDFDLLQEAVEGCLGYDLEVMTLQDPWHQVVLAQKPFPALAKERIA